ncbi:zinc finger MYM-type protein 1-like protein [Tanacetum coccineum]
MRGEWNGLQALILKECPYAYYVHCFAHQLQLALVSASKEVAEVHKFFKNLNIIVNVISSSCKRNDQLIDAQVAKITHLAEIGELETGKGQNQVQNVQRPGDTRWSSHFRSICSLMSLYGPAYAVLSDIAVTESMTSQKGDASYCLEHLLSFDFIIVMHIMKGIMEIIDKLCQDLQHRLQDIVNALALVSTTKTLLQKLRDEGWVSLMGKVTIALELNSRFNESVTELLRLTVALDPRKSFNIDDICKLVMKFYPSDFTSQEKIQLKGELQHYELDVHNHPRLKKVSKLSALCKCLHEIGKSKSYPLVDRLIRLILTLSVSTASSERAFSAMKIVKTRLRTKMSDEYLKHCLIIYIEREISDTFTTDMIIDAFNSRKKRRVRFQMAKVQVESLHLSDDETEWHL